VIERRGLGISRPVDSLRIAFHMESNCPRRYYSNPVLCLRSTKRFHWIPCKPVCLGLSSQTVNCQGIAGSGNGRHNPIRT
jgi:hypothetical protein